MRRILAATAAVWAVLAVALVIAVGHRTATTAQPAPAPTVIILRQVNGKLTTVPAVGAALAPAGSRQLAATSVSPVAAPAVHATTKTS